MHHWLDPFSMPIEKDGTVFPARANISLGDGIDATDDPEGDATILSAKRNSHGVTSVSLASAGYTVLATDDVVSITAIGGASKTVTLPAAPVLGHTVTIKDTNYACSGAHTVVIQPGAIELENDNSTITLTVSGFAITLTYVGAPGWVVLSYGDSTTLPQPD